MFPRLCNPLLSNSFLLLGARGTGKSRLVTDLLKAENVLQIDLLVPELERRLRRSPSQLSGMIEDHGKVGWVFIDEIQKVPELLNLVHKQIESSEIRFALTGSSARKLKRGAANLLAGRAFSYQLFPLTAIELGAEFNLEHVLNWGSLPKAINSSSDEERRIFLESYAHTYVREEVLAEQLVRSVGPFESFLEVAAQMNGEPVNFSKIAREVESDHKTVRSYFDILVDTLLGFYLPAYSTSARKRSISSPKFYFFDLGVKRALELTLDSKIVPGTYAFGKAFETFVIEELYRLNAYRRTSFTFSYLRTQAGVEIDLILRKGQERLILVEIKSTSNVRDEHLDSLKALREDLKATECYCLSLDEIPRVESGVHILPWQLGIERILRN